MAKYKVLKKCYGSQAQPTRLFKEGEIFHMDAKFKPSKNFELIKEVVSKPETKKEKEAREKAEAKALKENQGK